MSENFCCLQYDVRYRSISTEPHVVSSQEDAGFTHAGVESARISEYKHLFVKELHSQITFTIYPSF
jgi:hypothetical protein